jgi:NitT/TauT family transport system permease protein
MRSRAADLVVVVAFYAALIGTWQLLYNAEIWSRFLFPSPGDVWAALVDSTDNGVLFRAVTTTLRRLAVGFGIAFVIGMAIGVATGTVRRIDQTLGSLVLGLQSLPSITWLPLGLLWFGLNDKAIVFVVIMGSVNSIAISARDGVRNIPVLQRRTAQVFGASRLQAIRYVTLPGMLPAMAQGLKLGWSFSWRSLMAGELLFVSAGIGGLFQLGRDLNDISLVMAMMGVVIAIGLAFDRLVFGPLESWVRTRWGLSAG